MVAISLYKGNLHKAVAVPHRWSCPTAKISRKDFKTLIRRRDKALSCLSTGVATTSNPNPNPAPDPNYSPNCDNFDSIPASEVGRGSHADYCFSDSRLMVKEDLKEGEGVKEEAREVGKVAEEISLEDCFRKLVEKSDVLVVEEKRNVQNATNDGVADVSMNDAVENINMENATSDVEKRRKEVKDKLEILNEKKHSLVQVLKQILNAEEQLKRQSSMQGVSSRPSAPLQVENTTDSGSMIRVNTPRTEDGNPCGDVEEGEADDISKDNTHFHHLPRTSSTSPSSDSQQRKLVSNTVPTLIGPH